MIEINGKLVEIDQNMVVIVTWLNNFPSVTTHHSCEGTDGTPRKPYVLFSCDDADLRKILLRLDACLSDTMILRFAKVIVELFAGEFRYQLLFEGTKYRNSFISYLRHDIVDVPYNRSPI